MDFSKAKRLKDGFNYFAINCLKIKTKNEAIQPFILNNIQMKAHLKLEELKARQKKIRVIFLKSRQVGISTYTEARYFHKVFWTPGKNAFVLSEASNSTANIFSMAHRYYKNLPEELPKPQLIKESSEMLEFETDSNFRIATAGSKSAGRSMTVNYLHGSEVAFWDNADNIISSLFPAIPDDTDSEVILESTANGISGQGKFFYDKVQEGLDKKSEWTTLFYAWHEHEEYLADIPLDFVLTEEEGELQRLYKLNLNQLAWRRLRIKRDYKNREHLFKQDFPSCIQEAFLRSGKPLVPLDYLERAKVNVFPVAPVPVVIGVDAARSGGDKTVITVRAGRNILAIYAFYEMTETRLAGIITRTVNHFKAKKVFIDYAYGIGTYDILCEAGMGNIAELINYSGEATHKDKYVNKRAEMYDNMRSWFMQDGGVCLGGSKYIEELINDVMVHPDLEPMDSNGKLGLEKKKDIVKKTNIKSPDFSDSLGLTFAGFVPFEIEQEHNDFLITKPKILGVLRWADM